MGSNENYLNRFVESAKKEYGQGYDSLRFLTPEEAVRAVSKRTELLESLKGKIKWDYSGTKTDSENLSPGCRLCGSGEWSCLFINNKCNCSCFYCPASQDEKGVPATNTVSFPAPEEYAAYLKKFGFKGASISGGEPLLTPKLTLSFIRTIKKAFGNNIYLWMYTNGTLADDEILTSLRDAGLDEIRFDIGATSYKLDNLKRACGVIPTVTVEIPAIPEEKELLQKLMPELAEMGVKHLNLHQLRLTPYNFEKLIKRNYTYIHGDRVTVLESELTALEVIKYGKDNNINLPVNYCSFVYKNRFQAAGARRRNAGFIMKGYETLTESGFIRTFCLKGDSNVLTSLSSSFSEGLFMMNGGELYVHPSLMKNLDLCAIKVVIRYSAARQMGSVSYHNPFMEVKVTKSKKIAVERYRTGDEIILEQDEAALFADKGTLPERFDEYEFVKEGLQEYI
ncbi:hypothetical protein ADMFC3_01640 [Geovibrio sp. ADMFC3]